MTPREALARVARRALAVAAVVAAVALAAGGADAAAGVAGGAALALFSFLLLVRGTARLADPAAPPPSARGGLALLLARYALLGAAAYVIVVRLRLDPLGVLAGVSSIPAALAIDALGAFRAACRRR